MKGLKCLKMIIFMAFFAFISIILPEKTANAFNITAAVPLTYYSGRATWGNNTYNATGVPNNLWFLDKPSGNLYYFGVTFNEFIPANSVLTLTVGYRTGSPTVAGPYFQYFGITPSAGWSLLDENCISSDKLTDYPNAVTSSQELLTTCTYTLYTKNRINYFETTSGSPIAWQSFISTTGNPTPSALFINHASYMTLDFNSLTSEDKAFLQNLVENMPTADVQMQEVADNTSATTEAIEEQNEKDDQDRDNLETQQSDAEDGADDSQVAAESTGTTLLTAFTGFVGALTSASPSNCVIDMDMGNMDLGNVNFCQMSPPPIFQTIASIMLIAFCVPLSIATATKVITLFRSFQS